VIEKLIFIGRGKLASYGRSTFESAVAVGRNPPTDPLHLCRRSGPETDGPLVVAVHGGPVRFCVLCAIFFGCSDYGFGGKGVGASVPDDTSAATGVPGDDLPRREREEGRAPLDVSRSGLMRHRTSAPSPRRLLLDPPQRPADGRS
jgi:hypothetical protein